MFYRENTFSAGNVFHDRYKSNQIQIGKDKLTASLITDGDGYLVRASNQMHPTSMAAYFEIKVLAEGEAGCIEIGLATSNNMVEKTVDVEAESLGKNRFYRYSSVGTKEGSTNMSENGVYGTKFGLGDIIGCALTRRREILFTLNGKNLGTGFKIDKAEVALGLYPCIKFSRLGWKIRANFGKKLFLFSLQSLRQNIALSSIEKSKGIDLSDENLTAIMRTSRFSRQLSTDRRLSRRLSRQLSTDMVVIGNMEAGLVQATSFLKPSVSSPGYFEAKITQENEPFFPVPLFLQKPLFHIALMSPSTDLRVFKESVFCEHSYWLASTGEKNANGYKWEPYTTRFGLNDIIGCGLTHDNKIFYTLNGDNLGVAFEVSRPDFEEGLTPAIRLGKGCGVHVNFGKEPFVFDINSPLVDLYWR